MPKLHALRTTLAATLASVAAATVCAAPPATEGVLAQLYAARPPQGSSYVRVLNPDTATATVAVAQGRPQPVGGNGAAATTYAVVKGGQPFTVRLDGKEAATLQVQPDTFTTLLLERTGGKLSMVPLDDGSGNQDALKAELRFYNAIRDCEGAQLALAPSGTPVFQAVKPRSAVHRAINPVSATVTAACGGARSPELALPALQPGDHYSLFLTGSAAKPVLRGQVSRTDPYSR
ncbi:alginate O-acetyltransferase AlgF [Cupriavidus basilensis]|uniref:Alginate biosynthesis protein AlgF n=1 Tax=Cupriavidus basilensis TaxID=68895 RepID=A0ABT6AM97_9BURK|nr:alginate O-acetyltransferase AlgF [Cupriavidus basilensis]MDF3833752.1 alginate O-acetyltransferase AlgF [Cupriavidus basilensis]